MPEIDRATIGSLVCVGFRGAGPGDAGFEADMDRCAAAHVGVVILFDVEVAEYRRHVAAGMDDEAARTAAVRNVLSPTQIHELTAELRRRLGPRLIISIDQEGGRVARLNPRRGFMATVSAAEFATLPAAEQTHIADLEAARLAAAGIDLNFAPCVDVALNHDSPIIAAHGRSFGADPHVVVECAERVIRAHRSRGVATCLKHFPGHGSAGQDSHFGLPDITDVYDEERELGVFRTLISRCNPPVVMAGHLLHRVFDADHPASLSHAMIATLLREKMGFGGVVATDSLDMRAISDRYSLDETVILALNAGVDMLLYGYNPADRFGACPALEIVEAVERAVRDELIEGGMSRIAASAKRIRGLR